MNLLDKIFDSGFTIDWTVVGLGWREKYLTRDQLISYAMDQIGLVPANQADLVMELAFIDASDIWTIERLVGELISHVSEDPVRAARVWRWVLLDELIDRFSRRVIRAETTDQTNSEFFESFVDLCAEVDITLMEFWGHHEQFTGESPEIQSANCGDTISVDVSMTEVLFDHVRSVLQGHREWLIAERLTMMSYV